MMVGSIVSVTLVILGHSAVLSVNQMLSHTLSHSLPHHIYSRKITLKLLTKIEQKLQAEVSYGVRGNHEFFESKYKIECTSRDSQSSSLLHILSVKHLDTQNILRTSGMRRGSSFKQWECNQNTSFPYYDR